MTKLFQNLWVKAGIERWLSDPNKLFLALLILFLPTQLGIHFWPQAAYVFGIRIDYLSPILYFSDLIILVLIALARKKIRTYAKKVRLSKTNILIITIVLLAAFTSILLSQTPILGIFKSVKIVELFLLGVVLYINRDNLLKLLPKILPITIIFESLLAIAQFVNKGSINGVFYFLGERTFNSQTPNIANAQISGELILRPYATFSHPNVLGGFLLIGLTVLLFATRFGKSNLSKIAIVLGTLALLLTMSRIPIVLFIFVLVVFAIKKYFRITPLFFILLIISVIFISPLSNRFSFDLSDTSIKQRELLINSAVKMTRDNPLFGVGLNNFLPSLPNYYKASENIFYLQPVHNLPLLIFSEVGLIGGVLILYLFFLVFMKASFESKLLLFLVFFISMFDHYFLTLQQGQLLLTLVLTLAFIKPQTFVVK